MTSKSKQLNIRISEGDRDRAAKALVTYGLTLSDAVRIFLSNVAENKRLPVELVMDGPAYDKWLKEKLDAALNDRGPSIPASEAMERIWKAIDS